jgi:hypothetical protein
LCLCGSLNNHPQWLEGFPFESISGLDRLNSSRSAPPALVSFKKAKQRQRRWGKICTVKSGPVKRARTDHMDGDPPSGLQGCITFLPLQVKVKLLKNSLPRLFHSQCQYVLARTFVQLVLLMPVATAHSAEYTLIHINGQRWIKNFLFVFNSAFEIERA